MSKCGRVNMTQGVLVGMYWKLGRTMRSSIATPINMQCRSTRKLVTNICQYVGTVRAQAICIIRINYYVHTVTPNFFITNICDFKSC